MSCKEVTPLHTKKQFTKSLKKKRHERQVLKRNSRKTPGFRKRRKHRRGKRRGEISTADWVFPSVPSSLMPTTAAVWREICFGGIGQKTEKSKVSRTNEENNHFIKVPSKKTLRDISGCPRRVQAPCPGTQRLPRSCYAFPGTIQAGGCVW